MEKRKSVKLRYRAENPLLVEGGFSQCCTAPATNPFASHCPNPIVDVVLIPLGNLGWEGKGTLCRETIQPQIHTKVCWGKKNSHCWAGDRTGENQQAFPVPQTQGCRLLTSWSKELSLLWVRSGIGHVLQQWWGRTAELPLANSSATWTLLSVLLDRTPPIPQNMALAAAMLLRS